MIVVWYRKCYQSFPYNIYFIPDFSRGAPVYDQMQGGEKQDFEKEFIEPHPPAEPRQRGEFD